MTPLTTNACSEDDGNLMILATMTMVMLAMT